MSPLDFRISIWLGENWTEREEKSGWDPCNQKNKKIVILKELDEFKTFSFFNMFWPKIVISPKRYDLYPND